MYLEPNSTYEEAWFKRGEIIELTVKDAVTAFSLEWDPVENQYETPEKQLEAMTYIITGDEETVLSGHVIRLEFDTIKLIQHGTSFQAVISILREALNDRNRASCTFSDPDKLNPFVLMRVRHSSSETRNDSEQFRKHEAGLLYRFYQETIESVRLHGIEKVKNVFIQEDRRRGGLMLDTDAPHLLAMININGTVKERCSSNHPIEVFRVLGVEAARQSIIIEIRKVYRHYGIHVGARHISLIADAMTCAGALMSLDRHGINHGEFNTLAQAAFEELSDVFTKAGVTAKIDMLCDNTSRIMLGRLIRVGTGSFELFLDRHQHETMAKMHHQRYRERRRELRKKRAIDDRMAALFSVPAEIEKPKRVDPMSYIGSGFGIADDDDDWDVKAPPIYSPTSPTSPIYSPASPVYSPASPVYSSRTEYDPINPGAQSPTYSRHDTIYDPTSPAWDADDYPSLSIAVVPQPVAKRDRPYDPESISFGFNEDEDE